MTCQSTRCMKSEKTGQLRVLHRNLLLPVSTFEENSMYTTLENSHDFYQIDPEKESAPDHGANYEEPEITASAGIHRNSRKRTYPPLRGSKKNEQRVFLEFFCKNILL